MHNHDFAGQLDDERVQLVCRQHPTVLIKPTLVALAIVVVAFAPLIFWHGDMWTWWVALVGVVVAAGQLFNTWLKWYYSVYIITDQRIRSQQQRNLFRKTAIDIYLNKVQNISYNIHGLGNLFGYGTIMLQTLVGDMVMTKIADCEEIYEELAVAVKRAKPDHDMDDINDNGEEDG